MELTNPADIRALLARHDFRFSKSLGQNFLTAAWVPADIADASGADARTGVLEVGPGIGCLTEQLAQRAGKVVSVELDERREEDQPSGVELRDPGRGVGVLERVEELALEIEIPAACDIGYDGPAIRWEGEGNAFVPDAERALPVGGEAVGQPVVVETEDKAEVAAERERQLVVTLPDPAFLVEGRGDRPIDGALFRPDDTGVPPEHLAVFEGHGDG